MPRISIIMGIYNTPNKEIVKEAVDSILNQSFKDFEFIICDDGSTDETYQTVKELINNDLRCILLKNDKNVGLAQTLNNCLKVSNGEYIARMDADDISVLTRLEEEVSFLDQHPEFSLVSGYAELFDEYGIYGIRTNVEYPQNKDMLFGPPFIHAAMLIRKKDLLDLGGYRVCKETLRAEDYDLWMRLYASGKRGYNLQMVVYKIREDKNAYKRRAYKYRFDEAQVRYHGFKRLGLLPNGIFYVIKPLIVGLIPQSMLKILRNEAI